MVERSGFAPRRWQSRLLLRVETLVLIVSLFFTICCNASFWAASLSGRSLSQPGTWTFVLALGVLITVMHFIPLSLIFNRWTARPLSALLITVTAFAAYYMSTFTVFLDPGMLRNVLRTDSKEAMELFNVGMLPHLLVLAVLPLFVLFRVRIVHESLCRAIGIRLGSLLLALLIGAGSLWLIFQDLAPMMRNNKEIRYLITPANYLYSLARVLSADASTAARPRVQIGLDAVKTVSWQQHKKPALFVIVVGETARAANWGLSGYARQTTPELAQMSDVINFSQVSSCGTNTEVSVPCLFSMYGRRNYDENKIRTSESLLNVLERAGLKVIWRDNQSGCKGVCDGVEEQKLANSKVPEWCDGERCLDEILLHGLDKVLSDNQGNLVLVMHQLGNHGPAYYKRYPPAFRKFEPVCETADLAKCSREAVVNAYDNALLYTDHMLAQTIAFLKKQETKYDSAMIYFSDHGESLGENGLYLHGVPYSIAPKEQTHVPMLMWFSPGYANSFALDVDCLRRRAVQPAAHDNLFHSVLGLLDVKTDIYESSMDLAVGCRRR